MGANRLICASGTSTNCRTALVHGSLRRPPIVAADSGGRGNDPRELSLIMTPTHPSPFVRLASPSLDVGSRLRAQSTHRAGSPPAAASWGQMECLQSPLSRRPVRGEGLKTVIYYSLGRCWKQPGRCCLPQAVAPHEQWFCPFSSLSLPSACTQKIKHSTLSIFVKRSVQILKIDNTPWSHTLTVCI